MGNSKVIFGNETLIDLTGDTVTANNLLAGESAHDRSGEPIVGTVTVPDALDDLTDVSITSAADKDLLQYNGTSGEWENNAEIPNAVSALEETGAVNLLPNKSASQTINNVAFTHNADDTISAHRVSESTSSSILYMSDNINTFTLPKGKYILSDGKSPNPYAWMFVSLVRGGTIIARNIATTENGAAVFDTSPYTYDNMYIGVRVGMEQTADVTFKPMIYDARFGTDVPFMPYAMTNRELTEFSSGVAPIENGATSSKLYYTGMHFIRNGVLCTCINTISAGGTFSLNTNYIESEKLTKRLYDVAFMRAPYTPMRSVLLPNTTKTYLTIPNSKYQVILMIMSINGGQSNFIGLLARRYDDALFKVVFGGTDLVDNGVIVCENTGATGLTIKVPNASGGAAFWILNMSGQSLGDITSGTYT